LTATLGRAPTIEIKELGGGWEDITHPQREVNLEFKVQRWRMLKLYEDNQPENFSTIHDLSYEIAHAQMLCMQFR